VSKITSKEIIDLSGLEAEIVMLEKANKALAELQAKAVSSANSIKGSMADIGSSGKSLVQLQEAAKKANSSFKSLQRQISNNAANIKTLQAKLNGTRAALGKFQNNAKNAANGAKQLAGATRRASGGMGKFTQSANRAASSLSRWATGLLGFHLVTQYGREIIKLGIDMDRLDFTYRTLIRDQEEYGRAMAFTSKIANDYGVSIVEVRDSFIKFKAAADAANISGSETEEMFDTFTKTSAVLGLSTEKAGLALRALSQIAAKGTVQMEELRGQLGEQIPGAVSLMAKGMGIALGDFEKLVAKGEIASKDALPALARQMKKTFSLDTIDNIDNAQSAVGRLNTAWSELIEALDTGEAIKIVAKALTSLVLVLKNNITEIIALIKATATMLVTYRAAKAVVVAYNLVIAAHTVSLRGAAVATRYLGKVTKQLFKVLKLNPYVLLATAVAGLIAYLYQLNKAQEDVIAQAEANEKAAMDEAKALRDLKKVIDSSVLSYDEKMKAIEAYQKAHPGMLADFELEADGHDKITAAIENQIKKQNELAAGGALDAQIADLENQLAASQPASQPSVQSTTPNIGNAQALSSSTSAFKRVDIEKKLDELYKKREEDTVRRAASAAAAEAKAADAAAAAAADKLQKEDEARDKSKKAREKREKEEDEARRKDLAERKKLVAEGLRINQLKIDLMDEGLEKELAQLELNYFKQNASAEGYYDIQLRLEEKYLEDADALRKFYAEKAKADEKAKYEKFVEEGGGVPSIAPVDTFAGQPDEAGEKKIQAELDKTRDAQRRKLIDARESGKSEMEIALMVAQFKFNLLKQEAELRKKLFPDAAEDDITGSTQRAIDKANLEILEAKKAVDDAQGDVEKADKEKTKDKIDAAEKAVDGLLKESERLAKENTRLAEEEVRRSDSKVSQATAELNAQIALADAGYAADIAGSQRKLELEKRNQAKALKEKEKAQKKEEAINTASEISNLVAASARIWVDVGFIAALPAIAVMFGSYAASKIAARAIAGKKKFADGGLEIIGGGSHASGNDTPLGFSVGGQQAYAERGEAHMIVSARNTAKYKDILPEIERGLNSGTFEAMLNANVSPSYSITNSLDMSRIESHLLAIRRNGEKSVSLDRDGNEIHRYKNTITRVLN